MSLSVVTVSDRKVAIGIIPKLKVEKPCNIHIIHVVSIQPFAVTFNVLPYYPMMLPKCI